MCWRLSLLFDPNRGIILNHVLDKLASGCCPAFDTSRQYHTFHFFVIAFFNVIVEPTRSTSAATTR